MTSVHTKLLIHMNAGTTTAIAALAARLRGARFVYSAANIVDFDLGQIEPSYRVRMFEWGARAADAIVVQTAEQAELCRERLGREGVVIASITEPAEARRGPPEAFLWVGRLVS